MEYRSEKEYLYQRKGPWPQPSPSHPLGEAPAVIHIPKTEYLRWFRHIGLRYIWNLSSYWINALVYTFKNTHLEPVSDKEFEDIMGKTAFSKFLSNQVEEALCSRSIFGNFLANKDISNFFVADFTLMQYLAPFPKTYISPIKALFEKEAGTDLYFSEKKIVAIYIPSAELVLTPNDGDAWELAKYYVLQGATYRLVLSAHALLHFPFDSINAITKTALPKDNIVFKLLYPHLDLTLILNSKVLRAKTSPVVNDQKYPFTGFTASEEGIRDLIEAGYKGIENNPYYKPYSYSLELEEIYSDYKLFLEAYYQTILNFVILVVKNSTPQEIMEVKQWADYISYWLPNFPTGKQIFEGENVLAKVITKIIWTVSIGHAADHYDYSMHTSTNQTPLRLRIPPPNTNKIEGYDRKKLSNFGDMFRYRMERKLFFKPTNVSLLCEVDYNFTAPHLIELNDKFRKELINTETELKSKGVKIYIPIKQVSASIQY